jgi:S-DNA-T family DNA segregation ATPase FtsK/SpoIIIE
MGYQRASKLIDQLHNKGIIGPSQGTTKPRDVLISRNEFMEMRESGSFDVLLESAE